MTIHLSDLTLDVQYPPKKKHVNLGDLPHLFVGSRSDWMEGFSLKLRSGAFQKNKKCTETNGFSSVV